MRVIKVDLYESLRNRVSVKMLCRDIQTIYRREGLKYAAEFFKLFIKSIGIPCEMDATEVAQTIENGGVQEFIRNNLTSNEPLNEDNFFANDENLLSSVDAFIQEFCEPQNPMIFDHKFLEALSICLNSISRHGRNPQSDSVTVYYSLKIAHDLENVRVALAENSSNGSSAGLPPDFFKTHIFLFLENCVSSMTFERSAFEKIPKFLIDIIRSSNDIYVLERNQLGRLMNFTQFQHKSAKGIMVFFDELLKNGKDSVKLAMLEFLTTNRNRLLEFLDAPNISVQIAAAKIILAAQRKMGNSDFLGPGKNNLVYLKMLSTNNNMREAATKFFTLTYKSVNAAGDHPEQTILQALSNLCLKHKCLEDLSLIMNQVYKFFPLPLTLISEVCASGQPLSFRILDIYVKKLMEDDVDEEMRRDFINVYMKKFPMIAAATDDNRIKYDIVFETLNKLCPDECGTSSEIMLHLKVVTDFVLSKMADIVYSPNVYLINCVLKRLANVCEYTKDAIKKMIKEWIYKFKQNNDFQILKHLSIAFYVHNIREMLTEKKWMSVLKKTTTLLKDPEEIHKIPEIVYLLMVHTEVLCCEMSRENALEDDETEIQSVKDFSDQHLIPHLQKPELLEEKIESLALLQAFSLIITSLVLKHPEEGLQYFDKTQIDMYKHVQMIVFGTPPTQNEIEFGASNYTLLMNGILNTMLTTVETVCRPEYSLNVYFAKIIFILAKNMMYEEALERSVMVLLRNADQASRIIGSTFYNFIFYQNEKTLKTFKKLVDDVMNTMVTDENLKISISKGIVMYHIQDVGRYITLKERNKSNISENANSQEQDNRLYVLKYIKDFLMNCSNDQKKDILLQQNQYIIQGYLNSREKDSLKAFNKSLAITTSS